MDPPSQKIRPVSLSTKADSPIIEALIFPITASFSIREFCDAATSLFVLAAASAMLYETRTIVNSAAAFRELDRILATPSGSIVALIPLMIDNMQLETKQFAPSVKDAGVMLYILCMKMKEKVRQDEHDRGESSSSNATRTT